MTTIALATLALSLVAPAHAGTRATGYSIVPVAATTGGSVASALTATDARGGALAGGALLVELGSPVEIAPELSAAEAWTGAVDMLASDPALGELSGHHGRVGGDGRGSRGCGHGPGGALE